jgi:hypothetical protein
MRRLVCTGLLFGMLACTGCFTNWNAGADVKTPSPPVVASKAPPLVRAEQITPENGHQICAALDAELTWEEHQRMLTSR